jgi:copper homeostasis protein
MVKVEVCVESVASALAAEQGGAHRIELCSALTIGGMTPSVAILKKIKNVLKIPINCLIRCVPSGFCYSEAEIELMKDQICMLKNEGADGFVIGCLTNNEQMHLEHTRQGGFLKDSSTIIVQ